MVKVQSINKYARLLFLYLRVGGNCSGIRAAEESSELPA